MLNLRDDLKISRGTMKQARHYEVSIDQALDEVIAAIQVCLDYSSQATPTVTDMVMCTCVYIVYRYSMESTVGSMLL